MEILLFQFCEFFSSTGTLWPSRTNRTSRTQRRSWWIGECGLWAEVTVWMLSELVWPQFDPLYLDVGTNVRDLVSFFCVCVIAPVSVFCARFITKGHTPPPPPPPHMLNDSLAFSTLLCGSDGGSLLAHRSHWLPSHHIQSPYALWAVIDGSDPAYITKMRSYFISQDEIKKDATMEGEYCLFQWRQSEQMQNNLLYPLHLFYTEMV